jgi:hypothetical protein
VCLCVCVCAFDSSSGAFSIWYMFHTLVWEEWYEKRRVTRWYEERRFISVSYVGTTRDSCLNSKETYSSFILSSAAGSSPHVHAGQRAFFFCFPNLDPSVFHLVPRKNVFEKRSKKSFWSWVGMCHKRHRQCIRWKKLCRSTQKL